MPAARNTTQFEQIMMPTSEEMPLPKNFAPGPTHVVCMRGNLFWEHKGNQLYRNLIKAAIPQYKLARNRIEKSRIVSQIIESVYCGITPGGFIKRSRDGMSWMACTNDFVREKIGQSLRDGLHGRYKSSTKAKKRRCKELKLKLSSNLETIVKSRQYVSDAMKFLSRKVEIEQPANDDDFHKIFLQANNCLLQSIKSDTTILPEYTSLCSNK